MAAPKKELKKFDWPFAQEDRYEMSWSNTWSSWIVEDKATGDTMATIENWNDGEIIVECLNMIQYDREVYA